MADSGLDTVQASPGPNDPDQAVYAEQLSLLTHPRIDLPAHLFVAALITASLGKFYPSWAPSLWLTLFCMVIATRHELNRRYRIASQTRPPGRWWGRWLILGALATGVLWGATSSAILVTSSLTHLLLVICVLGGMIVAGIVSNAPLKPAMVAFVAPVILMTEAALLSRRELIYGEIGLMLAVLTAVLAGAGRNLNLSITTSLRQRIELAASEAALANAQSIARVGSWEFDVRTGHTSWSLEAYRIFGFDPAALYPSDEEILERVHPDDRAAARRAYGQWDSSGTDFVTEHRIRMDDGSWKWVHEFVRTQRDDRGRAVRRTGIAQDITERKRAETSLAFANIHLKTQMEASRDGIVVMDEHRSIVSFNRRFAEMWAIPVAALQAGDCESVLTDVINSVKDSSVHSGRVAQFFDHPGAGGHDDLETLDGRSIHLYTVPLGGPDETYLGRAWFFQDVTEHKRALEQAVRLARSDALTGLANRSVLTEALRAAIAKVNRGATPCALLYLDLDHFKDVNDTLGHPAGDELLKAVAARLRANTRGADTIARFGGDEFAIIVTNLAKPTDIAALADKLIRVIAEPFAVAGGKVYTGVSIGIDLYGPEAADADALLAHADLALYEAKARGRGRYQFFTPSMDAEVRGRVAMATELREAIADDQLFLLYQPQVCMITGRITGVEALLRWRHPRLGVLRPARFVSIAEQMGLMEPLGHWVLWAAIRQAKVWLDNGLPLTRLSINLSALQFKAPLSLEADISAALLETGLPPGLLELELTEAALMTARRENSEVLLNLRQAGVTVAIDDFGAGYSSLHHLSRFPVDRIKIAETFVGALEISLVDAAIVKAAIGIAKGLNITVMAAGVATREQFDLLKAWGCGEAQGGFISPPIEAERLPAVLRERVLAANGRPAAEDPAKCPVDSE